MGWFPNPGDYIPDMVKPNKQLRGWNRPQIDYLYTQREDVGKAFRGKKHERKKVDKWWRDRGYKEVRPGGFNFDYQYGKYRESLEKSKQTLDAVKAKK